MPCLWIRGFGYQNVSWGTAGGAHCTWCCLPSCLLLHPKPFPIQLYLKGIERGNCCERAAPPLFFPRDPVQNVQPVERLSSSGKKRVLSSLHFMTAYECFAITTTTTAIVIRAVRALEGWKGTKPYRFSRMFKFDETEPSKFNPISGALSHPTGCHQSRTSALSSQCQLGPGQPGASWGRNPQPLRMGVKLTELSWMWAEGRESSALQLRPGPSGFDSLHWEPTGLGLHHCPVSLGCTEISGWKSPSVGLWRH